MPIKPEFAGDCSNPTSNIAMGFSVVIEIEIEIEIESESEIEIESESESGIESDSESGSEIEIEIDSEIDSEVEAEVDACSTETCVQTHCQRLIGANRKGGRLTTQQTRPREGRGMMCNNGDRTRRDQDPRRRAEEKTTR